VTNTGMPKDLRPIRKNIRLAKCSEKCRYRTVNEAVTAADRYNEAIALVDAPMTAYFCSIHQVYHTGHRRNLDEIEAIHLLQDSRARSRNYFSEFMNDD